MIHLSFPPRRSIEVLGQTAAASSMPTAISKPMLQAAKWLEANDLAVVKGNKLVLTDDALQTRTVVSCPVLVADPTDREHQSLWSLRKQLVGKGWTLAKQSETPSVCERIANGKSDCKMYFTLLLDCSSGPSCRFVVSVGPG